MQIIVESHPADETEIGLQTIGGHGLGNRTAPTARDADRITHVMQTVEARHEIQIFAGKITCHRDFEPCVRRRPVLIGMNPRLFNRGGMRIVAHECRLGNAFAMVRVEKP